MTVVVEGEEMFKCYPCIKEAFEVVLCDHDYDDDLYEVDETASDEEYRRQMAAENAERDDDKSFASTKED